MPQPSPRVLTHAPSFYRRIATSTLSVGLRLLPCLVAATAAADWSQQGGQTESHFGARAVTAGDVNGDGYSDVLVTAPEYDGFGQVDRGRAYLYEGGASGLSTSTSWTYHNGTGGSLLGTSAAPAGDLNGDGYDDVILGAPGFAGEAGRVYVFFGSAGGLSSSPSWAYDGSHAGARLGEAAAGAGDVNGDGFDDVIVGEPFFDAGKGPAGQALLFLGSAAGLAPAPDWTYASTDDGAELGAGVHTAGDVNGDGYDDLAIGACRFDTDLFEEGRVFVFHGGPAGPGSLPDWIADGDEAGAWFGYAVSTAGDMNGDGYADLVVGAPRRNHPNQVYTDAGAAYVYRGSATGLAAVPAWTDYVPAYGANYGKSVAAAGDVNGDGYGDIAIGAPGWAPGGPSAGGYAIVLAGAPGDPTPFRSHAGDQADEEFGASVATAGDVDGDGFSDYLVGSPDYDGSHVDGGRCRLFAGTASFLANDPQFEVTGTGTERRGESVAFAGDVNGDGYSDLIAGCPDYTNGESREGRAIVYHGTPSGPGILPSWIVESDTPDALFGQSVHGAGDVNGDGYADVVICAPTPPPGIGTAAVYHGSPSGLAPSPDWTCDGATVVSGAGDVNGDGYADVLVGARYDSSGQNEEGSAAIYFGSPAGLAATPSWQVESDQELAHFGADVAGIGDANGDGYDDIAIGAPGFNAWSGAVFVYHGGASGPGATPATTITGGPFEEYFGEVVAPAGDFNGDGFADLAIGDPWSHEFDTYSGAAHVYFGSTSGVGTLPLWSTSRVIAASLFGWSISTVGDLNGDGCSDLMVGSPEYGGGAASGGAVYLYAGATGVPSTDYVWFLDGDSPDRGIGRAVAAAGDLNGDAFDDVVIGAVAGGSGHAGEVLACFGNGRTGRERTVRQLQPGGSPPIAPGGISAAAGGFAVSMQVSSPAGRSRCRIEIEAKPSGVPFDGSGTTIVPGVDTGTIGVTSIETVSGLGYETPYRWRARILDDSPLFAPSRWMTIPGSGESAADFRTAPAFTHVESEAEPLDRPTRLQLAAPMPNPAKGRVAFRYSIPYAGRVRLALYDIAGRRIASLVDADRSAGSHVETWTGRADSGNAAALGVYFARLSCGGSTETRRVLIVR